MTPEQGFQLGLPLLISLPQEVKDRLLQTSRNKSPNGAFNQTKQDVYIQTLPEEQGIVIAKTIRRLTIIRQQQPSHFEQNVSLVMQTKDLL